VSGRQILRAGDEVWCPDSGTRPLEEFVSYYRHAFPVRTAHLEFEDVDTMRKSLV
jgi:hypothetical protein